MRAAPNKSARPRGATSLAPCSIGRAISSSPLRRLSSQDDAAGGGLLDAAVQRLSTAKIADTGDPVESVAFSPDGQRLVSASGNAVWVERGHRPAAGTPAHSGQRDECGVQPDGDRLASAGDDSPMNTLLLSMLGAVAEFERSMILERQREGIALAKAAGKYKGRKAALTDQQADELRARLAAGESVTSLAKVFSVSRQTVYNYAA